MKDTLLMLVERDERLIKEIAKRIGENKAKLVVDQCIRCPTCGASLELDSLLAKD